MSKVFLKLTTGKQEKLNLTNHKLNKLNDKKKGVDNKNLFLDPRNRLMFLSDYEKKQHENFVKGMKDPIWNKIK